LTPEARALQPVCAPFKTSKNIANDSVSLDENFNGKIVRGLRTRQPDMDMIRVQDSELYGADDPVVLEWAAHEGRILLIHDLDTMTKNAAERIAQGLPMAGLIFVRDTLAAAKVIDDLSAVLGPSTSQ
jgi:predicted nuclease of predicted toxin-antitoxin system